MADLTKEQIKMLQDEVQQKFGTKLMELRKRLQRDIAVIGKPSALTIQMRDNLEKEILEEKRKKYGSQS